MSWMPFVLSAAGAFITIAVVWGYNKKTLEIVEKSGEKQGSRLEALHTAFVEFREEVRVRLAYDEATRGARVAAGRAPRRKSTPPAENTATGRPRAPRRKS